MNTLFKCYSFLLMIILLNSQLTPDLTSPFVVKPPLSAYDFYGEGTTFIVKFSIASTFEGIHENEFISVMLNTSSGVNFINNYTCHLSSYDTDSTLTEVFSLEAVNSDITEITSAFCKVTSLKEISGNKKLTLTINVKQGISNNNVKEAKLAIVSSNKLKRSIRAQTTIMNQLFYDDVGSSSYSILHAAVENLSVTPYCPSPCYSLYPNSDIEITIKVQASERVLLKDSNTGRFVISWNNDFDTSGIGITSLNYYSSGADSLTQSLQSSSTLGLVKFTDNSKSFEITNVNEDLIAGRKFILKITGLKTKNSITSSTFSSQANIALSLYWKNSHSKLGQSISSNFLNITFAPIWFTANTTPTPPATWYGIGHPEFFDIYENASWPLRFVFTFPAVPEGAFFVLDTIISTHRIFNLIPSTCDFSDDVNNGYIDNTLGSRPTCFPLYRSLTENSNNVSGLYFKLPPSSTQKTISFVVWGVAIKCSENKYDEIIPSNLDLMVSNNRPKNVKKYSFNYKIYSSINQSSSILFSLNNLLAKRDSVEMYGSCNGTTIAYSNPAYNVLDISAYYSDSSYVSATKDVLLFKEFNDFNVSSRSSTSSPFAFNDPTKTKFLYDSGNSNTDLEFGLGSISILNTPLPIYLTGTGPYTLNYIDSFITIQLSGNYITKKSSSPGTCYLKWLNSDQTDLTTNGGNNLISTSSSNATQKINSSSNLLANGGFSTDVTQYIEPIRIISDKLSLTDSANNSVFPQNISSTGLGLTTDCYDFVLQTSSIKSLYAYIDFSYTFTRVIDPSTSFVNRMGRFIKLNIGLGVFNNPLTQQISLSESKIKLFYSWSNNIDDLCILRIDKAIFSGLNNTLMLTLVNLRLLHLETQDISSQYPMAPILTNSFGLDIVYPFSHVDSTIQKGLLNNKQNYNFYSIIAKPFITNNFVKSKSDYYDHFGSVIIINQINTNFVTANPNPQVDLYIPVYCPRKGSETGLDMYSHVIPSIGISTFDITTSKINQISSSGFKHFSFSFTHNTITYTGNLQMLTVNNKVNGTITGLYNNVSLKFSSYSLSAVQNQNRLYIKGGNTVSEEKATNCDTMALLLTEDILVDLPNVQFTGASVKGIYNSSNATTGKFFYYKFQKFNKIIIDAVDDGDASTLITPVYENNYFNGVLRPTASSFDYELKNKYAFQCLKYGNDGKGFMFSNYNSNSSYFVNSLSKLDSDTTTWTVGVEKEYSTLTVYQNDPAFKINIDITVPSKIPEKSIISIKSDIFTSNAICSIDSTGFTFDYSLDCKIESNVLKCPLDIFNGISNNASNIFSICCHNILSINTNIVFKKESLVYYFSPSQVVSMLDSSNNDLTTTYAPFTIADPILSTLIPVITEYKYSETIQNGSYSVLTFKVNLQRPAVPNQRVRIVASFSDLYIPNRSPECHYTISDSIAAIDSINYGDNLDTGDYLIESCILNTVNGSIDLYNKNVIQKCGLSTVASHAIIKIYPIIAKDLNSLTVNTYTISSGIIDFTAPNYITAPPKTISKDTFNTYSFPSGQLTVVTSTVELCRLISIFDNKVGSSAKYTWFFDLANLPAVIDNKNPNEISIILDRSKFYNSSSITCSFNNNDDANTSCTWNEYGVINIKYNGILLDVSKKYLFISIDGLINPVIDLASSPTQKDFLCSVNYFNINRENILIGYGQSDTYTQYPNILQGNMSFEKFVANDFYTTINLGGLASPFTLTFSLDSSISEIQSETKIFFIYNSLNANPGAYDNTMKTNFDSAVLAYPTTDAWKTFTAYTINTSVDTIHNYTDNTIISPGIYAVLPNKKIITYNPVDGASNNYLESDITTFFNSAFSTYYNFNAGATFTLSNYKVWLTNEDFVLYGAQSNYGLEFTDPALLNTELLNHDLSVVYFGNSQTEYDSFVEAAKFYQENFPFFHCKNQACLQSFKVSNGDLLINNNIGGANKVLVFPSGFDEIVFTELLNKIYFPRNDNSSEYGLELLKNNIPSIVICPMNDQSAVINDLVSKINNEVMIIVSMGVTANEIEIKKVAGCSTTLIGHEVYYIKSIFPHEEKYKLATPYQFTSTSIKQFYDNYKSIVDESKMILTSDAIPNYNALTDITVPLVADNFESNVLNNSNDVVVYYYSSLYSTLIYYNVSLSELEKALLCFNYQNNLKFFKYDLLKNDSLDVSVFPPYPIIKIYTTRNNKMFSFDYRDFVLDNDYFTKETIRDFIRKYAIYPIDTCVFP